MTLEQQTLFELFNALHATARICAELLDHNDARVVDMVHHLQEARNRLEVFRVRDEIAQDIANHGGEA